jgi:hypothetical protein
VESAIAWLIVIAAIAALVWVAARQTRRHHRGTAWVAHLERTARPLFCAYFHSQQRFQVIELNASRTQQPHSSFALAVTREQIAIYRVGSEITQRVMFAPDQLRWFGRPRKYARGSNEIWLHAEIEGRWVLIKLWLGRHRMQALVRALKEIATPDQVTAYRRHRPYIHYGPLSAQPATQNLRGAWALDGAVTLYLMPLFLVILRGAAVERLIPLDTIQEVAAVRRLDRPRAAGLARFEASGEPVAYALDQHEVFAKTLAHAARRTLEDPAMWQRKKKKPGGGPDDDDDNDTDLPFDDDDLLYRDERFGGDDDASLSARITG